MSHPNRGYLTLAAGSSRYLEMAVDMALSLRKHTKYPIGLVCDEPIGQIATSRYPHVFDTLSILGTEFRRGRTLKYGLADACRWDEAIFVDADCLVLGTLDHAFDALQHTPMAFLGELLTKNENENHHGFSTRRLMDRFDIDYYLKTNSGFFAFKRRPARTIMLEFLRCFLYEAKPRLRLSLLQGAWLGDEIAIGIVGGRLELEPLPNPSAMYWPTEFDTIDPDRPTKPLLHFIWPLPETTFNKLMHMVEDRRKEAGVVWRGADHWMRELTNLKRMAQRRRWLERFKIGQHAQ